MTEDQLRELFHELRDEPVPPDSQARVRMAVAERTAAWPERLRRYWKAAALVLVPACAVLLLVLNQQPAQVPLPPPPVIAEKIEPVEATPAPPVVRTHRTRKPPSHIAEAATLIRIETPDPDVVILLVGGY